MDYSGEIIVRMQAQGLLALRLDNAVAGVREEASNQLGNIGLGAQRLVFYASCFTENYLDVCESQQLEDRRFRKCVYRLIVKRNVVRDMVRIFIEHSLKHRSPEQMQHIQRRLTKAGVYISTNMMIRQSAILGITFAVCRGIGVRLSIGRVFGAIAGSAVGALGAYGIVQKSADSARRLQLLHPLYYHMLYSQDLEMMFFLIEPAFKRSNALMQQALSDDQLADVIIQLTR